MADKNMVNPGLVNVADEADGLVLVDQAVVASRSYNAGPVVSVVDARSLARGLATDVRVP